MFQKEAFRIRDNSLKKENNLPIVKFIISFLTFFCRKHALNVHRMKGALFQVLCEIKEKAGLCFYQIDNYFSFVSRNDLCN